MRYRGLSDDDMNRLQVLLDWVSNQLIQVSYETAPASMRRHDKGDRCIDATPMRMFTTSRGVNDPEAMSMPQAANYVREGDHRDPGDPGAKNVATSGSGGKKRRRKKAKYFPALEAHLLVASDTTPGDYRRFPGLVTAMTLDRPALDPAGNARRLFASAKQRGFTPGYLTGDDLYAKATDTTFQIPARMHGYKVLLPITKGTSGKQGTHTSGALLVDGTYHCPAIPQILIDAIADLRAKRIDLKTFGARVRARKQYELALKQAPKNGIGERLGCRAADHSLSVSCDHKPNSLAPRPTRDRNGNLADVRPVIDLPDDLLTHGLPPSICQAQTITIQPEDGAKFRQALPIGDAHTDIYNGLRQNQEGLHGVVKDEAKEALGVPGRRRVRTKVAQTLFAAFLLAAANLRMIRSFLERAQPDKHGDPVVERTTRTGAHARSGLPPGTDPDDTAPPGDPPEDAAA